MLYLIKFGGNAISDDGDLRRICGEVRELKESGSDVILVHGGGPAISAAMEKAGLKPEKVNGVRITDSEGLKVVEKVLGEINLRVCETLDSLEVSNKGMAAYSCTLCKKISPVSFIEDGKEKTVDLGLVGEVDTVDAETLKALLDDGKVPVIYPIGSDGKERLNVNADTMAAGIAAAMKCDEMIAVTDVPGVLRNVNDPSSLYGRLTVKEVYALIEDGTIHGGMIPKVEACVNAVRAGARAVRMVNGKDPNKILSDITDGRDKGTVITE
ncbi:MAG: acetylglutamate kinase [Candidatus Methanomethylophilaceae archaeon]|jgi:acetylglutamate kinase